MSAQTHLPPGSPELGSAGAAWDQRTARKRMEAVVAGVPALLWARRAWMLCERAFGLFRRQGSIGVRQAFRASGSVLKATLVGGRFRSMGHSSTRQLVLEERLTLGPKQHLYLVRCGDRQLLVGSAGEAALQWMPLSSQNASAVAVKSIGSDCCGDMEELLSQTVAPKPVVRKPRKTRKPGSVA